MAEVAAKPRAIAIVVSGIARLPVASLGAYDIGVAGEGRKIDECAKPRRLLWGIERSMLERRMQRGEKELEDERQGADKKRGATLARRCAGNLVPLSRPSRHPVRHAS